MSVDTASLAFSVAQTLLAALQSKELKQICSMIRSYDSELDRLQKTVKTVKSVLLDAEAKQVLSEQEKDFIDELKDAVYDADDLLDELTAMAEQQQQHLLEGGKVPRKVRRLFSRIGKLGVAYKMSQQVKKIRKEFDNIADNASKFSFKVDYEPIKNRREETCSYIHETQVIGREKEIEDIINMLLADPDDLVERGISILSIVGMGGIGKTTLAQRVYHDQRVINEFPLRLWVCVSDHDQNRLLLQPLLAKILESVTGQKHDGSVELLQTKLRDQLRGQRYLLVLDDVWTEERGDWLRLECFLMGGGRRSQVVVTTRSKMTAQVVGSKPYQLQGLSDESSWLLFEQVALEQGEEHAKRHGLVEIGKDIVKKCANVPLSIRIVGSLLYGQGKEKWLSFRERGLAKVIQGENRIMSILKLSYHHLQPSLKSCFSYCALFPKDVVICKETLISLWMAQGYIEPLSEGRNIAAVCEEYFLILVRRCFFQDVKEDEDGEIVSCKIHDLMHDMAQEVAGKEIFTMDSTKITHSKEIFRHVFHGTHNGIESFFTNNKIRTFLGTWVWFPNTIPISEVLVKWTCLRALDLSGFGVESLPDTIGGLLHLRYLSLCGCKLKMLPESITKLHYLQTLDLTMCLGLKELPNDFSKLVKLQFLDMTHSCFTHMPSGIGKLTCLQRLTYFVVSGRNSAGWEQHVGNMEDLGALNELRGHLAIRIRNNYTYEMGMKGGYLSNKEHLNDIVIDLKGGNEVNQEMLLDDLQPHRNLRVLQLHYYHGVRIPRWAREERLESSLPNLVKICIRYCDGLKELTSLGKLKFLKSIQLRELLNLEYMENTSGASTSGGFGLAGSSFFPSLEELELLALPELKGWWTHPPPPPRLVSFPRLSKLLIVSCPKLTCVPLCPMVESLSLCNCDVRLLITMIEDQKEARGASGSPHTSSSSPPPDSGNVRHPKLRSMVINNVKYLKSLPMEAFRCLTMMEIYSEEEMESLSEMGEVLRSCSSCLRSLTFFNLSSLKSLSGGLEHLLTLESLCLVDLPNLSFAEEGEEDEVEEEEGMSWRCLGQSLRSLRLERLPKVVNLPKGMQYLTSLHSLTIESHLEALPDWIGCLSSLQSLSINKCDRIESLPESIRMLTSLSNLEIIRCSQFLEERCRDPEGEDWPKIQHIPYIRITSQFK